MTGPSGAPRVADRAAALLHARGVRHAFGMPGGEVMTFVDALRGAGIAFVLTRTETAGAIAAAATSLATGAPGLLVTTLGPGLANAVNGIADAAQERMPLLVVSGVVDHELRGRLTHQVVDQAALMRAAGAKASLELEPESAEAVIERAIRVAMTPPMGPVHLDLAPGTAARPAPGIASARPSRREARADPPPDPEVCRSLGERIAEARRPLLVAGFELARANAAGEAVAGFVAETRMPVLTTYKAKGVLDEHHPLALGAAGLSPRADAVLAPLVRDADLIVLAGVDPIEWRAGWADLMGARAELIAVTEQPGDHGMVQPDTTIRAPAAAVLAAVARSGPSGTRAEEVWADRAPARVRAALDEAFAPPAGWGPHAVFATLQACLAPDAVVTVDSGAHRILFSQQWRARRPLTVLQSAGWCTMGAALPLAMGAQLAQPGRPVVAVVGDGGLEMALGELGTLRDGGLPVTVVVLQDASLALIELKQRQAGLEPAGVTMGRTDLGALARAFGGGGCTVRDTTALRRALTGASASDTFMLIACDVQAGDYAGRI